jgi:glycine hydroxymethyltransferase
MFKSNKCYFFVDIAHIAGLVATGYHQSPLPYADVVTTTTHKTLRCTRGAIIMSNDIELGKKIDKSVFPGCQGGPLEHAIAAKAVGFGEALKPTFKKYIKNVLNNCKAMCEELKRLKYNIVSETTDNHLILVDLTPKHISGKEADQLLEDVGITLNKNSIPNDPLSPQITSGVRIGTAAITSRGFTKNDCIKVAQLIDLVLVNSRNKNYSKIKKNVIEQVKKLCKKYPIYQKPY